MPLVTARGVFVYKRVLYLDMHFPPFSSIVFTIIGCFLIFIGILNFLPSDPELYLGTSVRKGVIYVLIGIGFIIQVIKKHYGKKTDA
jgi:uncharacterized membrane protein YczE